MESVECAHIRKDISMNKYIVLLSTPSNVMAEWSAKTSPEERQKQMGEMMQQWKVWEEKHKASIKDAGSPLGKTKRVTKSGITDTKNDLNYCMVIEAESHDAAAEIMKDNPHIAVIPESYIEVMEVPKMGM